MTSPVSGKEASRLIDARIRELDDWRGKTLARMRALIRKADPDIVEEVKWMGTPVWSHAGIVCTGETYKSVVKLTFARGASLDDPQGLFNSSLEGNTRRAIDIREGEKIDEAAFAGLIRAAVAANEAVTDARKTRMTGAKKAPAKAGTRARTKAGTRTATTRAVSTKARAKKVVLLSGGNPQIAKGEGDAPVQAYIAAMPEWKRAVGERLDALIVRSVPKLQKAVKWNSPFYGVEGRGYFLAFHVFARYVKVTFFQGASLQPVPPGPSKDKNVRYLDIHEDDEIEEKQLTSWIKQAAALPGYLAPGS